MHLPTVINRLLFILLLARSPALGDAPAGAPGAAGNSQPIAAAKAAACCPDVPAGPFSKESVYQLDARFTDDSGQPFSLGALRGRSVVIAMFYATCGNACPVTVTDMLTIEGRLSAAARGKVAFVLVSFDEARDTPEALAKYRVERRLDGQWVLLHGGEESVRELAALLGVKYKRGVDGSFAHSNLFTILNAEGEIVHQRLGLQGGLDEAAKVLAGLAGSR